MNLIADSSSSLNHSNAQISSLFTSQDKEFTSQDKELLSVLESIKNINDSLDSRNQISVTSEGRLAGYFCSERVFNLSRKILIDQKLRFLKKTLPQCRERLTNLKSDMTLRNFVEG